MSGDNTKGVTMVEKSKKTSVLTDEDKRELTMAVKSTATDVMNPVEYEQVRLLAHDLLKSGALPNTIRNQEQVMVMISAGREMGMSPYEAIHDLYFVNGKLNIYGKATPAAIRRAGWQIESYDESPESCTATVYNPKTGERISDTFTFENAKNSGFTVDNNGHLKFGWKLGANRKRKLRYGALSQIIHTYIPDVLGACAGVGDYTEDYMESQTNAESKAAEIGKERALERLQHLTDSDEAETADENS